jgi:hypothetical protein
VTGHWNVEPTGQMGKLRNLEEKEVSLAWLVRERTGRYGGSEKEGEAGDRTYIFANYVAFKHFRRGFATIRVTLRPTKGTFTNI